MKNRDQQAKHPRISRFTINTILVLILILLGSAWWAYSSYQVPVVPTAVVYNPSATQTPTVTATPTITPTPTRTPRPTWTIRPILTSTPTQTPTPSQTPTKTRLPTITPARPLNINDRYEFVSWSADLADRAAQMAGEYPDVLYPKPETRNSSGYHAAFSVAVYAYREALLRYPNDPRAASWQWQQTYAMAHLGIPEAASRYAGYIQEALIRGDLRAEDLPEWFQRQEPRLTLSLFNIPAKPGQLNQEVVLIEEGGVFLWLIETPKEKRVVPIWRAFNFEAAAETRHLIGDLAGEGQMEIAIFQPEPSTPGLLTDPKVFRLVGDTPVELPVQAALPLDLQTAVSFNLTTNDTPGFQLTASLSPACPVTLLRNYTWDGRQFVPEDQELAVSPQTELVQYCAPILSHALSAWKPTQIIPLLEGLLPFWPPALDLDEQPYPEDAKDELRYQLGVAQALKGQFEAAVKTLQEIKASPVITDSRWVSPASRFLQAYTAPEMLYTACQQDKACNLRTALEALTAASQETDPARAQENLRLHGVPIRASGIFDFDQDGQVERWITIQPRLGQQLEFWILAATPAGVQARFIDVTIKDRPEPFYDEPVTALPPVFQLEASKGFQLVRLAESGKIFIQPTAVKSPLTTYTRDMLIEAQESLLSGGDPAQVRDSLLEVRQSGKFNCLNDRICDHFYYTLGLAYELAGDRRKAIDTYIQLWWEERNSPFTKIARMKIGVITPTPSATSLGPKTPTPGTPGSPTQVPTATPNAYPYP